MKVAIVEGCIGCGLCANACGEVFSMTSKGVAEVVAQPNASTQAAAQEAAESCPVSVIVMES